MYVLLRVYNYKPGQESATMLAALLSCTEAQH